MSHKFWKQMLWKGYVHKKHLCLIERDLNLIFKRNKGCSKKIVKIFHNLCIIILHFMVFVLDLQKNGKVLNKLSKECFANFVTALVWRVYKHFTLQGFYVKRLEEWENTKQIV